MLNKMLRNKKGFTLIELIVVIAILGILAAVLVPSITNYVDNANESTAKANGTAALEAAQRIITDGQVDGITYTTASMVTALVSAGLPAVQDSPSDGEVQVTLDSGGKVDQVVAVKGTKTATWSGGSWSVA